MTLATSVAVALDQTTHMNCLSPGDRKRFLESICDGRHSGTLFRVTSTGIITKKPVKTMTQMATCEDWELTLFALQSKMSAHELCRLRKVRDIAQGQSSQNVNR
jgi:hypothetical protein